MELFGAVPASFRMVERRDRSGQQRQQQRFGDQFRLVEEGNRVEHRQREEPERRPARDAAQPGEKRVDAEPA